MRSAHSRAPAVELNEKDLDLFRARNFGHVSSLLPDGSPHAAVVWIDEAEGRITFNSAEGSVKVRNLRRDPRVAVSVHDQENPYLAVVVRGMASLTTAGADDHIDALTRKYTDMDRYPDEWKAPGERRVKVVVTPETIARYGY